MVGKSSMFLQSSVSSRSSVFVYNCVVFPKVWLCPPGGVRRKPANDIWQYAEVATVVFWPVVGSG